MHPPEKQSAPPSHPEILCSFSRHDGPGEHLLTPEMWLMALPSAKTLRKDSHQHRSGWGGVMGISSSGLPQLGSNTVEEYYFSRYEVSQEISGFGQMVKYLQLRRNVSKIKNKDMKKWLMLL